MKIIQIGDYPQDENLIKGGVQASVFGLSRALSRSGNQVTAIAMPSRDIKNSRIETSKNLTIHFIKNRFKYHILNIFYLGKIVGIIKKESPDVVHIHGTSLLGLFLLSILRLKCVNTVITIHGIVTIEFWKTLKKSFSLTILIKLITFFLIEFLLINISKKIIADTQYVSDTLKKFCFREITIIPQGIDASFYQIPDNFVKNNIISIGVISPRKGYEYSIQAISRIKQNYPDLKYTIVGILKEENRLYYEKLNELVKKEKLDYQIQIHTDILFKDLQKLLEKAELFILHSAEESQGIVFCEAMAAKKPIVGTNIGGIPYVVKNQENGLLSPYGNVESFSNHINLILSDSELRKRMSEKSVVFSQQYNWSNIAKKIISTSYNNKV